MCAGIRQSFYRRVFIHLRSTTIVLGKRMPRRLNRFHGERIDTMGNANHCCVRWKSAVKNVSKSIKRNGNEGKHRLQCDLPTHIYLRCTW